MAAAPPPDQEKLRHDLRVQYKEAALSLVKNLKSESKCFYSHKELDALKVSLGQFDPFSDSKDSLFKPLSTCEFGNFSIDGTTLEGGARLYYFHFDEAIAEIANIKESETLCWEAAHQVFDRLRISYRHYRKKSKSGKTTTYMYESSNWDSMRDSEKVPNSFLDGPRAMRFGDKSGHSDIQSLPEWEAVTVWEWQEVYGDPKTTRPHVLLVTVTGTPMSASEGKAGLLHGELGPIAETIYCRLRQKEFEYISMFPVLVLSLFGRWQGRILQARFDTSGTLNVLASKVYNFADPNDAPWDLFIRYLVSEPKDGAEIEFESSKRTPASANSAPPVRSTISIASDRSSELDIPPYVVRSPSRGQENIPPKAGAP